MASMEKLNTHQKALRINLDPTSYGSFAEIGAGQDGCPIPVSARNRCKRTLVPLPGRPFWMPARRPGCASERWQWRRTGRTELRGDNLVGKQR
jgi:hypothetical protein